MKSMRLRGYRCSGTKIGRLRREGDEPTLRGARQGPGGPRCRGGCAHPRGWGFLRGKRPRRGLLLPRVRIMLGAWAEAAMETAAAAEGVSWWLWWQAWLGGWKSAEWEWRERGRGTLDSRQFLEWFCDLVRHVHVTDLFGGTREIIIIIVIY